MDTGYDDLLADTRGRRRRHRHAGRDPLHAWRRARCWRGRTCYVEKPLTLHCEEAEKLTALAESRGRILMVGHLLEYHPAITRLNELIEQGELGRLEYVYSNRLEHGEGSPRRECALEFRAARYLGDSSAAEADADPGGRHRRHLPAAEHRRRHGLDDAVRPRSAGTPVRQLAASLQGTEAGGGRRAPDGGVRRRAQDREAADLRQEDRSGERPVRGRTARRADDRVRGRRAAAARVPAFSRLHRAPARRRRPTATTAGAC